MLSFITTPRIVDDETAEQLQVSFDWIASNFDNHFFHQSTELVQPNRDHFPDSANTAFDMATALCSRILRYSGLSHWPFEVVPPQHFNPIQPPLLGYKTNTRQANESASAIELNSAFNTHIDPNFRLNITYSNEMMKKPMDLVGSMSKSIAQHYLYQSQYALPAGPESFDATAEIMAIFLGFGIFIANSAYTFRGSCARCYNPRANRAAALAEDEAIYVLALFCQYKNIDNRLVTPGLKGYLRSRFKKARKQVTRGLTA